MPDYLINGSTASMGPVSVKWIPVVAMRDHNQQPIYSGYDIEMIFSAACPAEAAQWLNAVSSGSADLQIIDRWALTFTNLSAVYCEITAPPPSMDIHVEGFTIMIHGVYV